jgi:hypothetical protein
MRRTSGLEAQAAVELIDRVAHMKYPGIARAALEIALDNGGISRGRSEKQMMRELSRFLAKQPAEMLPPINDWLAGLSDDEMQTVCAGEEIEMESATVSAPPFTNDLLNDYFEQVC